MAAILRLKRGHCRPHPWIFKGDVADVGDVEPGSVVTALDSAARFVGRGQFNPGPALCCRILTREDEAIDAAFFERRIDRARARRGDVAPTAARRLVWSEGDELGGLVVDDYAGTLVLQCLTLGMARARDEVLAALHAVLGERAVFAVDDPVAARREGFAPRHGWLTEPGAPRAVVEEDGVRLAVTFGTGHKTGLYLDQRQNRARARALSAGREVLDAFSYTGAFACHAVAGGAHRVVCLESSPDALAAARENLALNPGGERVELRAVNAFDELRRLERERARFDLVVLDPPAFARGRSTVDAAARGYKEINLRALRLLPRGGHLMTFSCSHHVSDAHFEAICRDAAADAGISVRVLDVLSQADDHPVLLEVPETRYLKGRLLEVR